MLRDFSVKIRHGHKPLSGATVEITEIKDQGGESAKKFTVTTNNDGIARIANLPPGDYWLEAGYLDIGAAFHCFHIKERPSRNAKRSLAYDWGDTYASTRRIAGKMVDSLPGTGPNPLLNLVQRVDVPIVAAKFTLQNAITKVAYHTTSDANGAYSFDGIPDGLYVLHIEAGSEATHHLIDVYSTATADSILFERRKAEGGSCGGTDLQPQLSGTHS
jgi:hypothetical protein